MYFWEITGISSLHLHMQRVDRLNLSWSPTPTNLTFGRNVLNKKTATPSSNDIYRQGIFFFTSKMTGSPNHAIVYGASGLNGWALINQLLVPYPSVNSFKNVTAVTNRPLDLSETYWPEPESHRPHLQLVSGVDLRGWDRRTLLRHLRQAVEDIEGVTHVYYLGMLFYGSTGVFGID